MLDNDARDRPDEAAVLARERRLGLSVAVLAVLPALAAVWCVPGFVTQDGPAHLYNAHILVESLHPGSPFRAAYEVRWEPLPNWAGHLSLMGLLMTGMAAGAADRVVMSVTLVGFAAATLWLRWRVAGWRGMPLAALLAVVLAANLAWLFGFYSFLLGACLLPITLGVWWAGRDRPGPRWEAAVAGLLVLGYFCHAVSLGLTVVGLVVLMTTLPEPGWARRSAWTLASLLPLVPLGILYRRLMQSGRAMAPVWIILEDPRSLRRWAEQLSTGDPLSLASKLAVPFLGGKRPWGLLLTPSLWCGLALIALTAATALGARTRRGEPAPWRGRGGWALLAALLILGGVFGPDSLGSDHGSYLALRLTLLGLVTLVPLLDLRLDRPLVRFGAAALVVTFATQSAFLWDYALQSGRRLDDFRKAKLLVGRGQRVGTLLLDYRTKFRVNPLTHADCLLGMGTGNVIWNNYEAAAYYFPVRVRNDVLHPPVKAFADLSSLDGPASAEERAAGWERLLDTYHGAIDTLVIWGDDPRLALITARWFRPEARVGNVRVLRRRTLP